MVEEGGDETPGEGVTTLPTQKINQVYYGVCIPQDLILDNDDKQIQTVFTDKLDAFKVLKEYKGSRFKVFNSEKEASEFSTSTQPLQETQVSTPVPSEGSTYGSLKSQQTVKFRKALESGNMDYVMECIRENPRYLMTPSDTPAILQEGSRYNALHVVAKSGKHQLCKIILDFIKDSLTTAMYPEADPGQNQIRQVHLLDLYLNMPDKGSGDTPLHLAAKMNNYEVVKLLTQEPSLDTTRINKFGESALDVIGSRAKTKSAEIENKIREAITAMHYIPVLRELDGTPYLGGPVPHSEVPRQLFRASPPLLGSEDVLDSSISSPRRRSGESLDSPLINIVSPRTPRQMNGLNKTFTLTSPGSPMGLRRNQGGPGSIVSPRSDQSVELMKSPLFISALIGPLSEEKAASAYKELKRRDKASQRFQDLDKGLERQCDSVAKRISAEFKEYWQFLDAYVDLTSEDGLQRLETHLNNLIEEQVRLEEAARHQELEDDLPANNSVFIGDELAEMEFFVPNKGGVTPVKLNDIGTGLNEDKIEPSNMISTPLSPLSSLTSALDGLDICSNKENEVNLHKSPSPAYSKDRRPSIQTKEIVDTFGIKFCQSLTENLPQAESDTDIQEWGLSLLNHWEFLRRQVNLMRSDPQGRWNSMDFSALACRIIECVQRELEDSVDSCDYSRVQGYLDRIASFKLYNLELNKEAREPACISEYRMQRLDSNKDFSRLKEIQPLARLLVYFMENRTFPEKESLEGIWDIQNCQRISTNKINKARKFLHSKVFSDSDSNSTSSVPEDFSWVHESLSTSNNSQDTNTNWRPLKRAESLESLSSQASSQYCTPPSSPVRGSASPAPSQASSMCTADEGLIIWMEGTEPTQTDRQVVAALQAVKENVLQNYPSLMSYFIMAGNYSMVEMKRWPAKPKQQAKTIDMEPRKLNLDFDMSALNMD